MKTITRNEEIATTRNQLATARTILRAAIAEYVASPCDITESTVASKGATVFALNRKLDAQERSLAALLAD